MISVDMRGVKSGAGGVRRPGRRQEGAGGQAGSRQGAAAPSCPAPGLNMLGLSASEYQWSPSRPPPNTHNAGREEREAAANTVFSDPVRTITTTGGNSSLSRRRSAEMSLESSRESRDKEASICFLLHNTLIVLELIFSRDKKYILN